MAINYPLHDLSENEFEQLVVSICEEILGTGTIPFASGKDGGRDGKFIGTAQYFPSSNSPLKGKFIIQAKHTARLDSSCSDSDFNTILNKELPKIAKLVDRKELDNYLIFTNRKLTGGKETELVKLIEDKTGVSFVSILGKEKIQSWLNSYPNIAKKHGLQVLLQPLQFYDEDIREVIEAFSSVHTKKDIRTDFTYISKDEKNKKNSISDAYFDSIIKPNIQYFDQIKTFLSDLKNAELSEKYFESAEEIQSKIMTYKDDYKSLEKIFDIVIEHIFSNLSEKNLKKKKIVRVFIYYMYFSCDIGQKE